MKLASILTAVALAIPGQLAAQMTEAAADEAEKVELYSKGLIALLGEPNAAQPFYLAGRVMGDAGRLLSAHVAEAVRERMAEAGYSAELAELAENGLWQVPRGSLFLILRKMEIWPGGKIAVFSIDVGTGMGDMKEVAFKYKKEVEEGWVLLEKGPAENEG